MFDLIFACDLNFGIGKNNKLPWHIPDELKIFKQKTIDNIIIVGKNTFDHLPPLPGRIILVLSRSQKSNNKYFQTLQEALNWSHIVYPDKKIFVAGGQQIFHYALTSHINEINTIHMSLINNIYDCDTFIKGINFLDWIITSEQKYDNFIHRTMKYSLNGGEKQYIQLISDVLNGKTKIGRNGETKSVFFRNMTFDMDEGYPLLTTKKMFFKGIVEELIFFIKGETNSKLLEEKNINIWKKNTERSFLDSSNFKNRIEGMMGPMYGYQWRFFGAEYDEKTGKPLTEGIDQLKKIIEILKTDSSSRRILMTDFNPSQADLGVLYPCHSIIIQFYVNDGELEMFCFNRSQDLFLGTPFNIASSALLLIIIAKLTNLKPKKLHMTLGDVHIYKEHFNIVLEQIKNQRYTFPTIEIKNNFTLDTLKYGDFNLCNYNSHKIIKAEMIA